MDNTPYKLAILAARAGLTIDELVDNALARNPTKNAAARDLQVSRQSLHTYLTRRAVARAKQQAETA